MAVLMWPGFAVTVAVAGSVSEDAGFAAFALVLIVSLLLALLAAEHGRVRAQISPGTPRTLLVPLRDPRPP